MPDSNALLWVALGGLGVYLYTQYKSAQPQLQPGIPNNANMPQGTVTPKFPMVTTPTTSIPNYSMIAPTMVSNNTPGPIVNSPIVPAVLTPINQTAPQTSVPGNIPILKPGQTIAIDQEGQPITDTAGQPLVFQPVMSDANYEKFEHGDYPGAVGGDCF